MKNIISKLFRFVKNGVFLDGVLITKTFISNLLSLQIFNTCPSESVKDKKTFDLNQARFLLSENNQI
ncbi:hypothetical protein CL619_00210 [archaeon]|nr:hypothetical protein [archaeon]|tara:strand:+ start:376 stop:576 length:201 start_codon:yes stop_codon:yes gene_type:complete